MKKKKLSAKALGMWLLIVIVLISELLFFTWCRVQYFRVGYEISEEMNRKEKLLELQSKLKIEFAHLKSPERIARIASEKLGLVMPKADQTKTIP